MVENRVNQHVFFISRDRNYYNYVSKLLYKMIRLSICTGMQQNNTMMGTFTVEC